jgi:membrane fusion protein, multidrug efflux system
MQLVELPPVEPATETVPAHDQLAAPWGMAHSNAPIATNIRPARKRPRRAIILAPIIVLALAAGGWQLAPTVERALQTISTDDAYVNSHVTFVAPRIQGEVARVLVDDNMRVSKDDLLVQLDPEPYRMQADVKKAAVANAEADLQAAEAQARAALGTLRSLSWKIQMAMEQVDNAVAVLASRVAALRSREATFDRARDDFRRAQALFERNSISREAFDQRLEAQRVA